MAKELNIDTSSSKVSFSVKKLGLLTVRGTLSDFNGKIHLDKTDLNTSFFDINISPISITTGNPKRDEHLKSKDFFFVKNYPNISFKTTSIHKSNGLFIAKGRLTILETTQEVEIPFNYIKNVITANFTINRLDYNLGEKTPSFVVGKTVNVLIDCSIL